MKKQLLKTFMAWMIQALLMPYTARADDWSSSGNYSISWYNKNQTEFTFTTAQELAGMAYLVNNGYTEFEGKTIKLGANIDLEGKDWIPCNVFKGIFEGQGHTIENVSIDATDDVRNEIGFFRKLANASVKNMVMQGHAKVAVSEPGSDTFWGFLAGTTDGSVLIENCEVLADMTFSRGKVNTIVDNIDNAAWSCIGGIVGLISNNATIQYCKHRGNMACTIPSIYPSNYYLQCLAVGGIAGLGAGKIQFCENFSSEISLTDNSAQYGYRYIGGILGTGSKSNKYGAMNLNILCCRSIVDKMSIEQRKKPSELRTIEYAVGGIVPKRLHGSDVSNYHYVATNCYSVINDLEINSKNPQTWFQYGGIGGDENQSKKNFSNGDRNLVINIEGGIESHIIQLYDGSTSFSSSQMQTPAFLEELNMYSMLEMDDGPVWAQDAEGGYPYIAKLYETAGVKTVLTDRKREDAPVYTLSSQRIAAPKKGVNIVGGRKVVVK